MLLTKSYPISCNFPSTTSLHKAQNPRFPLQLLPKTLIRRTAIKVKLSRSNPSLIPWIHHSGRRIRPNVRFSSIDQQGSEAPLREEVEQLELAGKSSRDGGGGGGGNDWTTSVLLFGLWAALMFYVFQLSPNQTPYRDTYFLQKLLNLQGGDGFHMNEVLVALWYIMGLWPIVYTMLLIPSGRSSRSKVPVWPFLILSFFGGAYALIPYFVLWKPPPPAVGEEELGKWPLNLLESKITAGVLLAAGLGLIIYAGLADGYVWMEFYQYFRESKFIHVTCLDFSLLSAFSPFWIYNDMTARKWIDRGSWLLPVALIPFVGPTLYLLLRPPLSALPLSDPSTTTGTD